MNLSNFKSKNASKKAIGTKVSFNENRSLFIMSNKHFFHGSHESLSIISKENFLSYYNNLRNEQRLELHAFFEALNHGQVHNVSNVMRTKTHNLSYVRIEFSYRGEVYTRLFFYFHGMSKLLGFRSKARFKLSLKKLLKIAQDER